MTVGHKESLKYQMNESRPTATFQFACGIPTASASSLGQHAAFIPAKRYIIAI
jgi:hypothetical protein